MSKRKSKTVHLERKTSADGSKVHVYLLVPTALYEWLSSEAQTSDFKNVQDKILDVLRSAREARQEQAA
jgi:hypothetical protein